MIRKLAVFTLLAFVLTSCGNDFEKSPLDNLIRDLSDVPAYSIILHDMNVEGTVFEDYYHQYEIIEIKKGEAPEKRLTDWVQVPEALFSKHIDDMGMELVSKSEDGKLTKTAAPPGYNNFVGNEQYGQWVERNGTSFWEFYGQYMFLNSMFNLATYPVRRSYYDTYRTDYWGRKPYYGSTGSGGRIFGTGGSYTRQVYSGSSWNRQSSSFKDKVRNSVSRSGTRYNGSSSTRSRGGGFGK
ncbi:hypothetical protein [Cesiribacter sp. SM1]|uniref:hypothetical protein n=1 Tax=Cesiribacter sp. SM1 TaxID=2861196 RepID=UPI001CD2E47E|nr:hypothetical protein [Cesiribacter sp. SM1]